VIWRLGAGLFFIVNVQMLDDGAVQVVGAPTRPRRSALPAPSSISPFRWHSSVGRAPFS
jgi:hypothetical protein